MRYFFYGTLCDPDIRVLVLGPAARDLPIEPATLDGWRCVTMLGCVYPVIVPARGAGTPGCLSGELGEEAVALLVRYEGPEYRQRSLPVTTTDGRRVIARAFTPSGRARPSSRPWSLEEWERIHKTDYLRRLRGAKR